MTVCLSGFESCMNTSFKFPLPAVFYLIKIPKRKFFLEKYSYRNNNIFTTHGTAGRRGTSPTGRSTASRRSFRPHEYRVQDSRKPQGAGKHTKHREEGVERQKHDSACAKRIREKGALAGSSLTRPRSGTPESHRAVWLVLGAAPLERRCQGTACS